MDSGPFIPLDNTETDNYEKAPPDVVLPPELSTMEDMRPEDALDRSVPSLDDLREGKLDTMEDRPETLVIF